MLCLWHRYSGPPSGVRTGPTRSVDREGPREPLWDQRGPLGVHAATLPTGLGASPVAAAEWTWRAAHTTEWQRQSRLGRFARTVSLTGPRLRRRTPLGDLIMPPSGRSTTN